MALITISLLFGILTHVAYGVPLELPRELAFDSIESGNRIVGGVEAPDNHSPHMVGLVFGFARTILNFMCGASIISESHVLTAAHCIDALTFRGELIDSLRGVFGSNDWDSTDKTVTFTGFINHKDWNAFTIKNDIGVLFVKVGTHTTSEKWIPIPLNYHWVNTGHKGAVAGWGRLCTWCDVSKRLQLLYVYIISEEECLQGVKEASGGWWIPPVDQKIEICTMHPKGLGFGMCNGDSGSALVSLKSKTQIGIVSWGFPCARGAPDVFVRISGFQKFLRDILKK